MGVRITLDEDRASSAPIDIIAEARRRLAKKAPEVTTKTGLGGDVERFCQNTSSYSQHAVKYLSDNCEKLADEIAREWQDSGVNIRSLTDLANYLFIHKIHPAVADKVKLTVGSWAKGVTTTDAQSPVERLFTITLAKLIERLAYSSYIDIRETNDRTYGGEKVSTFIVTPNGKASTPKFVIANQASANSRQAQLLQAFRDRGLVFDETEVSVATICTRLISVLEEHFAALDSGQAIILEHVPAERKDAVRKVTLRRDANFSLANEVARLPVAIYEGIRESDLPHMQIHLNDRRQVINAINILMRNISGIKDTPEVAQTAAEIPACQVLPDFTAQRRLKAQMLVYMQRQAVGQAMKGEAIITDSFFHTYAEHAFPSSSGSSVEAMRTEYIAASNWRLIAWLREARTRTSIQRAVEKPALSPHIGTLFQFLERAYGMYVKGAELLKSPNAQQKERGRLYMEAAKVLAEHTGTLGIEIEAQLAQGTTPGELDPTRTAETYVSLNVDDLTHLDEQLRAIGEEATLVTEATREAGK